MKDIHSLEGLIYPITPQSFKDNHWESGPLRIDRSEPDFYNDLFGIKEANEFLSRRDIHFPKLILVKDGKRIENSKYLFRKPHGKDSFERVVDNDKLFHFFNRGATIIFQDLGRSFQSLHDLTQSLENELNAKSWVNGYLTPPNSKGFRPHLDTHDVFIVQLFGSKEWKLYDHPERFAHKEQDFDRSFWGEAEPSAEFTLHAGDLIYIPKGLVHVAHTEEEASLHLTIGVSTYRWMDLFKHGAEKLHSFLEMRRSVGDGFFESLDEKSLKPLLEAFSQQLTGEVYDSFQELRYYRQVQDSQNRLMDSLNLQSLSLISNLKIRKALRFGFKESGDELEVQFYKKKVSFPAEALLAFEWIETHGKSPFQVFQLPDNYSSEAKINICSKLVSEGFLTFCD